MSGLKATDPCHLAVTGGEEDAELSRGGFPGPCSVPCSAPEQGILLPCYLRAGRSFIA